jgi:hypothetical protein
VAQQFSGHIRSGGWLGPAAGDGMALWLDGGGAAGAACGWRTTGRIGEAETRLRRRKTTDRACAWRRKTIVRVMQRRKTASGTHV